MQMRGSVLRKRWRMTHCLYKLFLKKALLKVVEIVLVPQMMVLEILILVSPA